jgi:hypothetical protein
MSSTTDRAEGECGAERLVPGCPSLRFGRTRHSNGCPTGTAQRRIRRPSAMTLRFMLCASV